MEKGRSLGRALGAGSTGWLRLLVCCGLRPSMCLCVFTCATDRWPRLRCVHNLRVVSEESKAKSVLGSSVCVALVLCHWLLACWFCRCTVSIIIRGLCGPDATQALGTLLPA